MNKTRPPDRFRPVEAVMLNHITKVQNISEQKYSIMSRLMDFATSVPNFRRSGKGNFRHQLKDMIMLMILGRLCGCVGRAEIIEFDRHNIKKIRKMSMLKNGVPSEATLCRVGNGIDELGMSDRMQEFIGAFHSQLRGFGLDKEIICIEGKALRGTVLQNVRNPDIVSAYSFNTGMTLQRKPVRRKATR